MKKILAIAVVLSALGAGVMFADDSTCKTVTKTLGTAAGCYGGFQVGQTMA